MKLDLDIQPVDPPARVKPKCWPRDGVLADNGLQDALEILIFSLDEYTGHFADLKMLEVELKLLQETLRVKLRNKTRTSLKIKFIVFTVAHVMHAFFKNFFAGP